jgi:hypothetical protein
MLPPFSGCKFLSYPYQEILVSLHELSLRHMQKRERQENIVDECLKRKVMGVVRDTLFWAEKDHDFKFI